MAGSPDPRFWWRRSNQFQQPVGVGAPRLVRIGDDEAELVGEVVHPRSKREVLRILGAAMQHEHERELPPLAIGRDIEPVAERTGGAAIDAFQEALAEFVRGLGLGRRARRRGGPRAQGAQDFAQRTARRGRNGGAGRKPRRGIRRAVQVLRRLARQRPAQKSGRLDEIRLFDQAQRLAHGVDEARLHWLSHWLFLQRRRSASAALTSAGACSAPSTVIDSIVAVARSGVTSSAMTARPSTRMLSRFPAA